MSNNPSEPATLETLPDKLSRLIAEWKAAQSDPTVGENARVVADRKLAEMVAFHPELVAPGKSETDLENVLLEQLMTLPKLILELQTDLDASEYDYQVQLTTVTLAALNEPMFAGKTPADPKRPATNETERSLAISKLTQSDLILYNLAIRRDTDNHVLQEARNQFEAARLAVQLLCREKR